jgi:alpha-galactosidase
VGPRITIVGGGSSHWTPTLLVDFANTECLHDAEVALTDVVADSLPPMLELGAHIAGRRGIGLKVTATTDLRQALESADVVIVALSVGGFDSMQHDIEIPARYGLRQPVGDSVGPGGIFRALRSVPVVADIARTVEEVCPDALLINVSNPLTALCRATAMQRSAGKVVGLCNEIVGLQLSLSLLFDASMLEIDPVVAGVNHLPLVTEVRVGGESATQRLADMVREPGECGNDAIWLQHVPSQMHWHKVSEGPKWTKADVLFNNRLKFDLFERFGVLPGSSDTHVAEFFAGFVAEESDFGRDWGVHHYGMEGHRADKDTDGDRMAELMAADEVPRWHSGELVANLLEGLFTGVERALPMNLPNEGQVTNLEEGRVVECMGVSGAAGLRPRDRAGATGYLGEHLRRVSASQEMTVEAALHGDRTAVLEALLSDPMAARLPYEQTVAMADELFTATAAWLPQFTTAS